MNLIKVILLLFLVLKSSSGFTMPMMSCCDSPKETIETSNNCDNEEDRDCCGGFNCECLCCSHVFTLNDYSKLSILPTISPNKINAAYIDRLSRIYSNALWQPPQYS